MSSAFVEPARLPPSDLVGLDPSWSRLVSVRSSKGKTRTWHLLDNAVSSPRLTLLCVHGNPSWSYLWRGVMAEAPSDVRVVAVDQLDMGFSERTGTTRRLSTRIDDLCDLTEELAIEGPVLTVAHDWGGPISLGWAQRHRSQLAGVVLMNTAVHQPVGSPAPSIIRLVRRRRLLQNVTVRTAGFISGALAMSRPRLSADVRRAFNAPYESPGRREAIAYFVEDIPLDAAHPSADTLDGIAAGLEQMADVPALLLWGPSDMVFSDLYLHDLEKRLPHADVHRFAGAGHFVSEDADVTSALYDWIDRSDVAASTHESSRRPLWSALDRLDTSDETAVMEMPPEGPLVSFRELAGRVKSVAGGLASAGVSPGDRVALMVPPGIDLTVVLYACWRLGAVTVVIDAGLGRKGMTRAFAAAAPDHLIGIPKALAAAKVLRWPGRRFSVTSLPAAARRSLGVVGDISMMASSDVDLPDQPADAALAAVVFTSGATGPSKGVIYQHQQLQAQRDALMELYGITPDDRLVAAFAPFALFGPAMGIASVVPDMDVTAPSTLTAAALGDAAVAVDATLVFASPAALTNVVRTADGLTAIHRRAFERVRLLLSAGAPVGSTLLRSACDLFPNAEAHTPYGMTELLPVADIGLEEIEHASGGDGVCVGYPLPTVEVMISGLDDNGRATGDLTPQAGVMGEVIARAPHARYGYDRLWHTDHKASQPPGWHRTGDVGHFDPDGRLWIGGRTGHVISCASGAVTPVRLEQQVELLAEVELVAVVGVGPIGAQVIVAVVELTDAITKPGLADLDLHDRVREITSHDVVAVIAVPKLPVDRRHNSKIDRALVARWAEGVLAGGRVGKL